LRKSHAYLLLTADSSPNKIFGKISRIIKLKIQNHPKLTKHQYGLPDKTPATDIISSRGGSSNIGQEVYLL
jgi:hypothetical protein